MSFESLLSRLIASPGALAAAFMGPQGEAVAQVGDDDTVQLLGAFQSVWLGEMQRASRRADLGELAELSLDFQGRRIVSAEVKDGYFLLVVLEPDGLVAPVRARLDDARRSLATEI